MNKQITVRLDDETKALLSEYKDGFRFTPNTSEIVREALKDYLREELSD